MFFRTRQRTSSGAQKDRLTEVVRAHLQGADDSMLAIVAAIAGLLGTVAYADRELRGPEWDQLRHELGRINGLDSRGVEAICGVLKRDIVSISTTELPRHTRVLRELASRDLRIEILGVLLDLAASDGTVSLDEVNLLRNTACALGLSQREYNDAQAPHRDKLSVLRGSEKG
ncbi:MAG: TerB family tellurite resistance protein [Polyangiaceae bacterium]|nr:TerB family tellurite resistance protein [Polyangiaceae bacterium]